MFKLLGVVLALLWVWFPTHDFLQSQGLTFLSWFFPREFADAFRAWAISIHEVCHGLAAVLTGGSIHSFDLQWTHGTAWTQDGWYPMVSMAGYTGTAIFGAVLLYTSVSKFFRYALIGILISFSTLLIIYNPWSLILLWVLFVNVLVIVGLFWDRQGLWPIFFATSLLYTQWQDVQVLFWQNPYETDAGLLASHIGLPFLTWPIALFYTSATLGIWYVVLKKVLFFKYEAAKPI